MRNNGRSRRMDAMDCLFDLQQEGVELELTPAGLDAHGLRRTLTPDVQARIAAHFPALIRILRARDRFRERASRDWVPRNGKWVWAPQDDPLVIYACKRLDGEVIEVRPTGTPLEVRMAGRPWAVKKEARTCRRNP